MHHWRAHFLKGIERNFTWFVVIIHFFINFWKVIVWEINFVVPYQIKIIYMWKLFVFFFPLLHIDIHFFVHFFRILLWVLFFCLLKHIIPHITSLIITFKVFKTAFFIFLFIIYSIVLKILTILVFFRTFLRQCLFYRIFLHKLLPFSSISIHIIISLRRFEFTFFIFIIFGPP